VAEEATMRTTRGGTLATLAILAAILLLVPLLAGGMMGSGMMGPWMMPGMMPGRGSTAGPDGWAWGMGLGWLMMLAFWGALILGVALVVGYLGAGRREPTTEPPLEILRRRFAAGDLTAEQFEHMRQALEGAR
jgi:putative membrane protein